MISTPPGIGTKLGPYEILEFLGAGGMGEVYRARDSRLRRNVAVKVLPAGVADDRDQLKRLLHEARAVSQLNHPNIVAIYDIGSEGDTHYVVMELLEGKTLADCVDAGPLPPGKALSHAIDIARGLTAAHEKQIVHRDLKPANIFITRDGRVKILDFGLARQLSVSDRPGQSSNLTLPGMVVGTPAYMSPEQARGLTADHRSDLFSFGVVMYEMLSGVHPFEGESALETMMNVIQREPLDLAELVPNLPPILNRVVTHCMEKAPEARFQSASDLVFDLETCSHSSTAAVQSAPAATGNAPMRRRAILAALAILPLFAVAFLTGRNLTGREAAAPEFRRMTFRRGIVQSARFTADGRTIVYSAAWDGSPLRLHVLRIERPESQSIAAPNATLSAISPDGEMAVVLKQKIFDWTDGGTLAQMPLLGGPPRELAQEVVLADWSPSGEMAVVRRTAGGMQLEYPIGKVLDRYMDHYVFAMRLSPKGDQIAVHVINGRATTGELHVISAGGKKRTLVKDLISAPGLAWKPDGSEIWYSAGDPGNYSAGPALFAVSADGERRLLSRMPGWLWLHDISRDGVALVSHNTWQGGIIVPGTAGGPEQDLAWLDWSILADIAADGKRVLFTESRDGVANLPTVYVRRTDEAAAVRLGEGVAVAFSGDGKWVLAFRPRGSSGRGAVLLPLQAGETKTLRNGLDCLWAGWLPDGRIVLSARTAKGPQMFVQRPDDAAPAVLTPPGTAIGFIDPGGGGAIRPVSPDGRWIAVFDREKRAWLYPVGGGAPRRLPGMLPGDQPAGWSADGKQLYVYQSQEVPLRVHAIDAATGRRTLFKEITLADPAGVFELGTTLLMPDGLSFARGYKRTLSTLYTVKGLP